MRALNQYRHWVFDMDGTLTLAVHDFAAIKRELGIAPEDDILGALAKLPATEAAEKHAWLLAHERELAHNSIAAEGACELIRQLHQRGVKLGILTRNAHELALLTLEAIGLLECFDPAAILGRESAAPKPDPAGLLQLAKLWGVPSSELLMVGDFVYDLQCARAAGATSMLVNRPDNLWPEVTDWHAQDCTHIQQWLEQSV